MPGPGLARRIGPALLGAALLLSASGLVSEVARARAAAEAAMRRGAPAHRWRFESPEVRRLRSLVEAATARIGGRGPVVFRAPGAAPAEERFVFLWAQFLGPDLDLVLERDLGRQPVRPSHWLAFGPPAEPPRGARRRVQLPGGTLYVLR